MEVKMESVSSQAISLAALMASKMLTEALVKKGLLTREEAVQAWSAGALQLEDAAPQTTTDLNIQAGVAMQRVAEDIRGMTDEECHGAK